MKKLLMPAVLGCAAAAWATGSEWVPGRVMEVDAARGHVTLKHGPINAPKMAAMTMPFKAVDGAILATLKRGDRVRFTVVVRDDALWIERIESVP